MNDVKNNINTIKSLKIKENVNLSKYTTFKIGGRAKYYAEPRNIEEFNAAVNFAKTNNINYYIIGGGANLLISDIGVDGLAILTRRLNKIIIDNDYIIAESGASVTDINKFAIKHSLSGLEFSAGLPGSIGGASFMNARSYGSEFSQVVDEIEIVDLDGNIKTLSNRDICYKYKQSIFMSKDYENVLIYKVKLKLTHANKKDILTKSNKNIIDRRTKGQYKYPSAGCIFKNNYDINIPSGKIIEDLGLKGYSIGGAKIYEKHANFIINYKKATALDVFRLISHIETEIGEKKGYTLDREIKLLGEFYIK